MTVDDLKGKTVAALVSGGLDSCTVVRWLADHEVDVVCITIDLGQKDDDLEAVKKRMLDCGAREAITIDGQQQIAEAGVLMIQSQALYEGTYWNTTGIARNVTVDLALPELQKRGIKILTHGATGRGNDQVRFQIIANMLDPTVEVYAPWRDEAFLNDFGGRKEMIDFCEERGLPIRHSHDKPYSTDANLLGLTHEAGKLESLEVPALFITPEMGNSPVDAPDTKETFSVKFEKGWPTMINGKQTNSFEAFDLANQLGGKHGIGIGEHVLENRFVGIKSRGVYEMPGIALLGQCYDYLLELILDRRARELFDDLSRFVGKQIYQAYWLDTASQAALAAIKTFSDLATGTIEVELYKGKAYFKAAKDAPHNLYSEEAASMEKIGSFDHKDSEGLLRILGVSAKNLATQKQVAPDIFAQRTKH
jgi:argininosuccinate synthase